MARLQALAPKDLYREWRSGPPKPAYYFTGEDSLAKAEARQALLKLLKADPSCIHQLQGPEVRGPEFLALAGSLGLFSEARLIWVENAHKIPAAAKKPIAEYLEDPNPSTCLVFSTEEWKTDVTDPVLAGVHGLRGLVNFRPPTGEALREWAGDLVRKEGCNITPDALERLIGEAGEDRAVLKQELERAALFCKGKGRIEASDVAASLGFTEAETVYRLALLVQRAMAERTPPARRAALEAVEQLFREGEEPVKVYNWIGYAVQHLLAGRRMLAAGAPAGALKFKVRAYYNDGLAADAPRVPQARLMRALRDCLQTEIKLKTGATGEMALVELKDLVWRVTA